MSPSTLATTPCTRLAIARADSKGANASGTLTASMASVITGNTGRMSDSAYQPVISTPRSRRANRFFDSVERA